ncbi:MAG: GNAT family N-acetyltransferase [Candidatus Thorarchaeota archaeon]
MISYDHNHITLHPVCSKHLDLLQGWRNDPEVWDWCRQFTLIDDVQQRNWFEKQSADPTIEMLLIKHRGSSVGVCGLTDIDYKNRRAEFSLYIGPENQGKGLSTPALKTLFQYGFLELNLQRIWGECFEDNPANHIFKKLGMEKEGARRNFYFKNGGYVDAILWSVDRAGCRWLITECDNPMLPNLTYEEIPTDE